MSVFDIENYAWLGANSSGAKKLSQARVAPLVARARGYFSITAEGCETHREALRYRTKNSSWYRTIMGCVDDSDALYMPWFSLARIAEGLPMESLPSAIQLRPARPIYSPGSHKPQKYVNEPNKDTVIDAHPSLPQSWVNGTGTIMVTEGLLKADSALTAYLLDNGLSDTDMLLYPAEVEDQANARGRLTRLMNDIPAEKRLLILGIIGVGNWHGKPDWNVLNIREREALLCFDADVSKNYQVWNQANKMSEFFEHKHARGVRILQLPSEDDEKSGVDDFFASGHGFGDLDQYLGHLPPRPAGQDIVGENGQWLVSDDGNSTSEIVVRSEIGSNGMPVVEKFLIPKVPFGGRVVSFEITRAPSDKEMRTGILDTTIRGDEGMEKVDIEVTWKDEEGDDRRSVIHGPSSILASPPKDWIKLGASVPINILSMPQWPPSEKWLSAMKAHRSDEVVSRVKFNRMGWIPSHDRSPYFIVGNQRVAWDGIFDDADEYCAVNETGSNPEYMLAAKTRFGVVAPDDQDSWVDQAREDLKELAHAYFGQDGAWINPAYAAISLALMARPALFFPPRLVCYLQGPPASGKSWTAGAIMQGWQPRGGIWSNQSLPGSARDTIASTEISVAMTPLWVMDDFAPSVNKMQAERTEAGLSDLIRSIHDGSPKRRANAKMGSQKTHHPHALFMITAENEPSVSSVLSRVISLPFGKNSLRRIDRVNELASRGVQARIMGAYLRWLATVSAGVTWERFYALQHEAIHTTDKSLTSFITAARVAMEEVAPGQSAGNLDRAVRPAADLMFSLYLFSHFAYDILSGRFDKYADGTVEYELWDLSRRISEVEKTYLPTIDSDPVSQLVCYLYQKAGKFEEEGDTMPLSEPNADIIAKELAKILVARENDSPGERLLKAVSQVLSMGQAALVSPSGGEPSITGVNSGVFGWTPLSDGTYTMGNKPRIGYVDMNNGMPVVFLKPSSAFSIASRLVPELVSYGQKGATSWKSAIEQGLVLDEKHGGWTVNENRGACCVSIGDKREWVVPVLLSTLLEL